MVGKELGNGVIDDEIRGKNPGAKVWEEEEEKKKRINHRSHFRFKKCGREIWCFCPFLSREIRTFLFHALIKL